MVDLGQESRIKRHLVLDDDNCLNPPLENVVVGIPAVFGLLDQGEQRGHVALPEKDPVQSA